MSLKPITREEMFLAKAGGEDVGELKPITRREKFLDRIAGGGGGDLPFGEKVVYGDTLTWDGNTDGLVGVNADGIDMYFKVSESTPTAEEFKNGVSTIYSMNDGSEVKESLTEETIHVDDSTSSVTFLYSTSIGVPSVVCTYEDNLEIDGMVFSEKGLYLFGVKEMDGFGFVSSLTINGYNGFETTKTVPIPNKYLPEHLQFGEEEKVVIDNKTYSYSEEDTGYLIDTFDVQNGETYKVVYNGVEYVSQGLNADGISCIGNLSVMVPEAPDTGEPFLILNMGVMLFIPKDGSTADITLSIIGKELTKLPSKYYQTKKVLYYGLSDKYLYHDMGCIQKVTMEEFDRLYSEYPLYIGASYNNSPIYQRLVSYVCYAAEGGRDGSKGYAVYIPSNWLAYPNQYDIYYTAEYTE